MRAGDMDRRITILRYELAGDDGWGNPVETYVPTETVWAEVRQEGGREFFAAASIQSERKVVFRLRWIEEVRVYDRVLYDDREHNIHEVKELGRQEGLELHTTAEG